MTAPLGSPPPPAQPAPYTVSIDLSKLPSVATALGVSLVSAAIVTSAFYSRKTDDLDVSNFTMGVLATLGLLAIAGAARLLVPDPVKREMLVSWPGAFGTAGVGLMLATLINNDKVAQHVAPLAALVFALIGYLLIRSTPFALVALGSLALLYQRLFNDLFDTNTDHAGGNVYMLMAGGVLVFVVAATALGWLLPASRVVTSVVTGAVGLALMAFFLGEAGFTRAISYAFSGSGDVHVDDGLTLGAADPGMSTLHDPYKNDIYMILLYCAALAALWFVCALLTDHVAFRLLVLATGIVIIPLATFAMVANHPTWWEVVTATLGGLVLGGIGIGAVRRQPPMSPTTAAQAVAE